MLILVAGLGVSSRYWSRLGRRLAGDRPVVAPDLPGFGRTPKVPGTPWPAGPSVREQADQLLAWMDARGLGRVVLFGHSLGCQTVVDLAARHPDRVDRVILAAPTFEPSRRTLARSLPRLALGALFEVPSLPPLLIFEYASIGVARAVQQAVRAMSDPIETKLPRVTARTLVIHGEFDPLVSRSWSQTVAARLPRAALVVVERVGHAMHYSAAAVTADVVRDFLQDRLDVAISPMDGGTPIAPPDDPRRDALGPPQPISPRAHALLDLAINAFALALPKLTRCGRRARRTVAMAAALSIANNAVTGRNSAARRKLPMVTHASVDLACGVALLLAVPTVLRRERPAARWAVVGLGCYQVAAAILTAKPTGPARRY